MLAFNAEAEFEPLNGANGSAEAPTEDQFAETPYTQYGEFNEDEEQAAAERFFQYGRFFGVSIGVGYHQALGNRGRLWQGGFPHVSLKFHYWFDFNFALDLEFYTASHDYLSSGSGSSAEIIDVNITRVGADFKYYVDTSNLTAAITFAQPYILLGIGTFQKNELSALNKALDEDNVFGLTAGGGLEFIISHKRVYFAVEGKVSFPAFKDRYTTAHVSKGIQDLTGPLASLTGNLVFTW